MRLDLTTLSIKDFETSNSIKLIPNPSSNFIQILGLTSSKKYKIYNVLGVEVDEGILSEKEKLNINGFATGTYFLIFDNGNTFRFVKK